MKRLLAQIGITAFTVLAVAFYLPDKVTVALAAAASLIAIVFIFIRRTRKTVYLPVIAITIAVACAANIAQTYLFVKPLQENCSGSDKRITATLTDEEYRSYSKFYYRLSIDSIDGEPVSAKLLLKTARKIDIEPYDKLSFTAEITPNENAYYLSKGYYITVNTYNEDFTVTDGDSHPLYYHIIRLRQSLRAAFDEYLPEDAAALCKAVFVGDKYALGTDIKDDFRYAGASHFVVVSGMHFSIICLMLYSILRRLRVHRVVTVGDALCLILVYMAVTGFQPSVVRSGVMMITLMGSRLIRRVGYVYNSLGLAGLVSCFVFTPLGIGDIGLILSFAATFAVVTWTEPIHRKLSFKKPDNLLKRGINAVTALLSASLAANILVFPISVFVFKGFSTVTLVSSLLLYLPIELILLLSLPFCILFYLGPLRYVALILSWPMYGASKFVLWVVNGLSSLPFSYVYIGHVFFYIWMGVTVLLGVIVIARRDNYRMLPIAAVISMIILICGTITCAIFDMNRTALEVYSCGEGLTVGLCNRGDLYMLSFDAKSAQAYELLDDLSRSYGSAELAVCSRKHDFKNYSRLTDKEFAISHYLLYDDTVSYDGGAELIPADSADSFILGEGATLTVTVAQGKALSYLTVDDTSVLIIPSKYPFKKIPEEYRTSDIIVISEAGDGYDGLRCGRLIVSNTAENADISEESMAGCCRELYDTRDGDITVDLR